MTSSSTSPVVKITPAHSPTVQRYQHFCIFFRDDLYLFGGRAGNILEVVHKYDTRAKQWFQISNGESSTKWPTLNKPSGVVAGNKIYFIDKCTEKGSYSYNFLNHEWKEISISAVTNYSCLVVQHKDNIVGLDQTTCFTLSLETEKWDSTNHTGDLPDWSRGVMRGDICYIVYDNMKEIVRFNVSTLQRLPGIKAPSLSYPTVSYIAHLDALAVHGAKVDSEPAEFSLYKLSTTLNDLPAENIQPQFLPSQQNIAFKTAASTYHKRRMYVHGGFTHSGGFKIDSTLAEFNFETQEWRYLDETNGATFESSDQSTKLYKLLQRNAFGDVCIATRH